MANIFSIRLSGPAKVGGLRRNAGDVVEIDQAGLDQLLFSGVVAEDVLPDAQPGFRQADVAALSEKLTLAEAEINHLGRELDIKRLNSASLSEKLTLAEAEIAALKAQIDAKNTRAAKTTQKGAAAS